MKQSVGYEKNQVLTVEIIDITSEGEGIGKIDGFPFFVKDAVIGDHAQVRVTRVKKNYAYARLEKVLVPSPFRVDAKCMFHKQCGGCQIQAMDYGRQLAFKERKVRNNLVRIGGFAPEYIDRIMEPIVGMEEPFYYRNKAQYPIGVDKEGNPIAGFYAGRTHNIIANTDCCLGAAENKEILEVILSYMKEYHVPAYDETRGGGLIRHVLIRKGFTSGEIMVCLVINYMGRESGKGVRGGVCREAAKDTDKGAAKEGVYLPSQEKLTQALAMVQGMTSVSVSINRDRTNVIMGKEIHTIWGKDVIRDTIHVRDVENDFADFGRGITFSISPLSFYQVNPVQTEKLYSLALAYAGLTGTETVWDLYCGIGTISLFLAEDARQVYGVEIVAQAVEDARENAEKNGICNAQFLVGKAEEVLPEKYEKEGIAADVIVVDPPRKGCDGACLETMIRMAPEKIVYVSCDSATLARDLRVLCDGGYEVKRCRAVDMFPMTVHVETCVLLSKLKSTQHIEVKIDLDEMDLTKAESKATYAEIKDYVLEKYNLKVSQLYIAQVKRKHGIIERINYNTGEGKARVPQVPLEKEKAIEDALRHFQMI
ncbi:MAG: 23S rRNA (uracil(1939)-C(5))-methyltransferase RlmD [Lachnospiraceae bacterium]|jgi:23S rRNA (uracil1939-C5)-methyltransferase|nr:23S rRNA (uracil(1939)-C(5))-methyltransferase RlmD [Lachnospiraceae bacterium]